MKVMMSMAALGALLEGFGIESSHIASGLCFEATNLDQSIILVQPANLT